MGVMTSIILGSVIASTVMKARAAHKQGKEDERVNLLNAGESEESADDVRRRGLESENVLRRDVRTTLGSQRAGYAAQGVSVEGGTPAALGASGEGLLQSDLTRIHFNAQREAMGYKKEADEYRHGAEVAKSNRKWAVAGAIIGGGAEASMLASRMNWGGSKKPAGTPTASTANLLDPSGYAHVTQRRGR